MITRQNIIQEAKSWVGTRFHHQGRIKKSKNDFGGCDCLAIIIGVAKKLNIPSGIIRDNINIPLYKFDRMDYGRHPSNNQLYNTLSKVMNIKYTLEVGDVILFNIQNRSQHLAIYSYNNSIIHCLLTAKKVIEHPLSNLWKLNISQIFSFKGIC